jgi:hypothetical protein
MQILSSKLSSLISRSRLSYLCFAYTSYNENFTSKVIWTENIKPLLAKQRDVAGVNTLKTEFNLGEIYKIQFLRQV